VKVEEAGRPREFSQFLRAKRESIAPGDVGLPLYGRRRTPGLRREEVASIAGIGVAWYSKLEMGHEVNVSPATLLSIARALHLNPTEIEYMFVLANVPLPHIDQPQQSGVPEAVEQLVEHTARVGLVLWDHYMTPLRWNATADAMFDFASCSDPFDRNSLVRVSRDAYRFPYEEEDYEALVRSLVGMFRRAYTTGEPTALARRVYEAARESPIFQKYWHDHLVAEAMFDAQPGPFERHHPIAGTYRVTVANMKLLRREDVFLRIMAPVDDTDVETFARLAALGTASVRDPK
jgi:transcriptional regulator with XRE-family HTH domain